MPRASSHARRGHPRPPRAILPRLAAEDPAQQVRLLANFLNGMIASAELRRLPVQTLVRIRYVQMQLAFAAERLQSPSRRRRWLARCLARLLHATRLLHPN